jgi:hypothetical protein
VAEKLDGLGAHYQYLKTEQNNVTGIVPGILCGAIFANGHLNTFQLQYHLLEEDEILIFKRKVESLELLLD